MNSMTNEHAAAQLDKVLQFALSETMKLVVRERQLLSSDDQTTYPPRPGSDHLVVKHFILDAREHPNATVRQRIQLAVDKLNVRRRAELKIPFTRTLERLVVMGALNHYTGIRKEIDPDFKLVTKAGQRG